MHYIWQFYLLLVIISIQGILLAFSSKKGQSIFLWLCFLELAFLAGFRDWHIGNDTYNYITTFINSITHTHGSSSYMERGYIVYNNILAFFTSNPQAILISNALFITGNIFCFIKRYSQVVLLPVLLFIVLQFSGTMNIMRQYLAVAIILCGIPFVVKRQFILFLLCCMLATTFHYSSVLAVGLYFLYPLSFKTKYLSWIFVGTIFAFIFLAPILEPIFSITGRYEGYQGKILLGEETKIASIMKFMIQLVIAGFCYFTYRYIYNAKNHTSSLHPQFLLFCSVISACLQFISIRGTVLERLTLYYSIFSLISIPFFVHCYPKKTRVLVAVGLLGFFVLYHSIIFIYRPTWNEILPFKFCF